MTACQSSFEIYKSKCSTSIGRETRLKVYGNLKLSNYVLYDESVVVIYTLLVLAAHTNRKYLMIKNQP